MTISTQDSKVNYQGNGQTTVFQIPFPFLENNQIYVQKKDAEDNLINYTYGTDYTVTGAGEENGGSVTLNVAPEQGSSISIYRDVPLTQEVDYRENEIFPAETHEEALDKLTMEVQQIQEQLDRSVKVDRFSDVDLDIFVNEIDRVYNSTDNIDIVANNINDVNTVSGNIANVNTAATNMAAIQDAPNQAISAQNSATQAAQSAQKAEDKADEASESARQAVSALSLQIGDVFFAPLGIDESLNLRRYLNGQVLIQSQFVAFTNKVKSAIALYPNLATTEANWQAEKTNSKLGQCGKFVVDDTAGTIRLPCVVNAQGLVDLALIGGIKNESLPNITGTLNGGPSNNGNPNSGAFQWTSSMTGAGYANNQAQDITGRFDASSSSSTYQDNAPVQQEAVQYPYCIVVNVGAEEPDRPINNYQVNNVYSYGMSQYYKGTMNNNSWLKSAGQWNDGTVYTGMYNWLLEQMNTGVSGFVASTAAYTDYDFVVNTTDQTFRLPLKNGQEGVFADGVKGNGIAIGLSDKFGDGHALGGQAVETDNGYSYYLASQRAKYGSPVGTAMGGYATPAANTTFGLTTDPSKSGMVVDKTVPSGWNLYYYIGDTLQNAQLINVARIEETLVTKTNKVQAAEASMPSSKYIDLTLGASGSSYTAPANGTFYFRKRSTAAGQYISLANLSNKTFEEYYSSNSSQDFGISMNVLKGVAITANYTFGGTTHEFKFVYAEGEN